MPQKKIEIDIGAYSAMLDIINYLQGTEKTGKAKDLAFMNDDFWLQNTAVIESIELRKGEWNIYLTFAHYLYPLKFLKRSITHFSCRKKAIITAYYMRRLAAKDQRGTMHIQPEQFHLSCN